MSRDEQDRMKETELMLSYLQAVINSKNYLILGIAIIYLWEEILYRCTSTLGDGKVDTVLQRCDDLNDRTLISLVNILFGLRNSIAHNNPSKYRKYRALQVLLTKTSKEGFSKYCNFLLGNLNVDWSRLYETLLAVDIQELQEWARLYYVEHK